MSGFTFKNLIFVLLIASIKWFSSSEICDATRGIYWRLQRGDFGSMYKNKGKQHGGGHHHVDKSKPWQGSKFNVLDYGAKGDGKSDDMKVNYLFILKSLKIIRDFT